MRRARRERGGALGAGLGLWQRGAAHPAALQADARAQAGAEGGGAGRCEMSDEQMDQTNLTHHG